MDSIIIIGSDVCAIEAYLTVTDCFPEIAVVFAEDVTENTSLEVCDKVYPVVKDWNFDAYREQGPHGRPLRFDQFVFCGSRTHVRRMVAEKVCSFGLKPSPTIIHPTCFIARHRVKIGVGGFMAPMSFIYPQTTIGDFVYIQSHTGIGHEVLIGDYVNIHSDTHIGSDVTIEDEVEISLGCTINNGLRIAKGALIGAHSCVTRDVLEPGCTVFGSPAKIRPPKTDEHAPPSH